MSWGRILGRTSDACRRLKSALYRRVNTAMGGGSETGAYLMSLPRCSRMASAPAG